jgi:hypothetical protein
MQKITSMSDNPGWTLGEAAAIVATATALVATLEGARTIARLKRTPAVFEALADFSCQRCQPE